MKFTKIIHGKMIFLMKIVSEYLKVILPKKTFKAFTRLFNKFVDLK